MHYYGMFCSIVILPILGLLKFRALWHRVSVAYLRILTFVSRPLRTPCIRPQISRFSVPQSCASCKHTGNIKVLLGNYTAGCPSRYCCQLFRHGKTDVLSTNFQSGHTTQLKTSVLIICRQGTPHTKPGMICLVGL